MIQQFGLKKGLKQFGQRGKTSVMKELQQHHDLRTFIPVHRWDMTKEQRAEALSSLIFLMEKRDGTVKTRSCADGSKQRRRPGYKKEDNASPTMDNESLMITTAINAHERRDVMKIDLPGAFLHATNDELVYMLLKGEMAELMVVVDPGLYQPYLFYDSKGVVLMYTRMNKAMYGMLHSALLFYKKLKADLIAYGFEINPYDPCVATKVVNGKTMTVTWHVDDLISAHVDPLENTKFGVYLSDIYGDNITIKRGKVHDYLGMDLDFSSDGVAKVGMIKYIREIENDFPEELGAPATSPAAEHLFKVRDPEDARLLDDKKKEAFHHTTAQLNFLSSRARRDIQTAVSFLTTRVKAPDEDDWGKSYQICQTI